MAQRDRGTGLGGTLGIKAPCLVATTANITLSGEQTIDGVAVVAEDRVLVKNQTTGSENGIYVCKALAWVRAADFDGPDDVMQGTAVRIALGTVSASFEFTLSTADPITIGTTSLTFTRTLAGASIPLLLGVFTLAELNTAISDGDVPSTASALLLAGGNMTGGINGARSSVAQHATTMNLFATTVGGIIDGTGSAVTITAVVNAPQAGAIRKFYPLVGTILTHGATFDIDGNANVTAVAGDCWEIEAKTVSTYKVHVSHEDGTAVANSTILRGYLAGLKLSTAGASATMSIAAGQASDSTNADLLTLAAIAKITSAWAVGTAQGGIDTGAIANSTWYHFYVIRRPDTGVVDVIFSTNATTPTLPTNYTQYRRIGSGLTNGSAQWTAFVQDGGLFQWLVPVNDIGATNPGTSAVSATLSVPTGIRVRAWFSGQLFGGTSNNIALYFSDLSATDTVASLATGWSLTSANATAGSYSSADFEIMTNTSAQIRYRLSLSGAADVIRMATKGWYDSLGKDS